MSLTDSGADASLGCLATGINPELSLLPIVSIGHTIHASFVSEIWRSGVHMTSRP